MNETEMKPGNFLVNGSFIREALAIEEVQRTVRERLLADDKLPHFSSEKMASIVKTFLTEEEKRGTKNGHHKENGYHKKG